MAHWQIVLTNMTRYLIGDFTEPYVFDDSKIQMTITIAGLLVSTEYSLGTTYSFNLEDPDISPDPLGDNNAVALFTLKAACMLTMNQYSDKLNKGGIGVTIQDGDSKVSTDGVLRGYQDIINMGPCKSYQLLLQSLQQKRSMNAGKAIGTPFTHWDAGYALRGHGAASSFFDHYLGYR